MKHTNVFDEAHDLMAEAIDHAEFPKKYRCPECNTKQTIQGGMTRCINARCCWPIELDDDEGDE